MSGSFATPQSVAHQAPLSMTFVRQEYRSELPFPSLSIQIHNCTLRRSLVGCRPWGCKESDTTKWLSTTIHIEFTLYLQLFKAMATHSSTLAWKIPWAEEPGRLQFMGSPRVGHDWMTSLPLFTFMHWRRKWQPTPVFSPRESQGWRSLVGCCLWGHTESDTTEAT